MPLAMDALEKNCQKYEFNQKRFSKEAQDVLLSYNWPGNIRELLSVVERAAILSENDEITKQELFLENRNFN